MVQGVLSGFALAVGYGVGVFLLWLWRYMQLPTPVERWETFSKRITTVVVALLAGFSLWRATVWQDSIRELMEMPPLASVYAPYVAIIAIICGNLLVGFGAIVKGLFLGVNRQMKRILPERVANVISTIIVCVLVLTLANNVVAKYALRVADKAYLKIDGMVNEGVEQPTDSQSCGGPASLVGWEQIGRRGKDFVATGPTKEELAEFNGREAKQPVRVYVGLAYGDSPEERAKLALDELKRAGGFERSVLVVGTPTGTGWIQPVAVDPLEFLHNGDTAIVTIQYSYLPSFVTILVDPERSIDAAHALFDEVYNHWKTLPKDRRPKLYLYGLSLGALGSETCADLFTLFEDPIQGGVWSGPPFPSSTWSNVTKARNPESPEWLPTFRDGSMVRFTSRKNALNIHGAKWGPMRFVYIQHSSDPITFFDPSLIYRKPDWLEGERGPDVSPYLTWYPIVTCLQVGFDMPMGGSVPVGYGHNYSASSYIDAWVEVTQPEGWTDADSERLKSVFADRILEL